MTEEIIPFEVHDDDLGTGYIVWPDGEKEGMPWVLAVHGSGRSALSYRDVPFYLRQRDLILECGCAFAAISNGKDTWGTWRGFERIRRLIEYMDSQRASHAFAVWGSSAGGLHAFRVARDYSDRVLLIMGMFPVIDVLKFLDRPQLTAAWQNTPSHVFQAGLSDINPADFLDQLPEVPVVITHGAFDRNVPPDEHVCRYMHRFPGTVEVFMPHAGHNIRDFQLYDTSLLKNAVLKYKTNARSKHSISVND